MRPRRVCAAPGADPTFAPHNGTQTGGKAFDPLRPATPEPGTGQGIDPGGVSAAGEPDAGKSGQSE